MNKPRSHPRQTVLAKAVVVDGETHYIPVTEDFGEVKAAQKALRQTACDHAGTVIVPLRIWPGKIAEKMIKLVTREGGRIVNTTFKAPPAPDPVEEAAPSLTGKANDRDHADGERELPSLF
jgi:hypothetical protein